MRKEDKITNKEIEHLKELVYLNESLTQEEYMEIVSVYMGVCFRLAEDEEKNQKQKTGGNNMIKVGMIVKFNSLYNPNYRLGTVTEITEIKDSICKDDVGQIYYTISENDHVFESKIVADQIVEVFSKIEFKNTQE